MSEYIEIEAEATDDPLVIDFHTNLDLTGVQQTVEQYESREDMEEGSPLAQTLAFVDGIHRLRLAGQTMTVTRDPDVDWHIIVADVTAAVRDFFL